MLLTFFKPTWKKIFLTIVLFFLLLFVLHIGIRCLDCMSCGCEFTIKLFGISLYSEHTGGMDSNRIAAIWGNESLNSSIKYSQDPSFLFSFFSHVPYLLSFYTLISYILSCIISFFLFKKQSVS